MNKVRFYGKVFSGEGDGKEYLQLHWVKQQLEEKLGITPYLGTLNLKLTKQSTERRKLLSKTKALIICPEEGYCVGLIFKALIGSLKCVIVLPQIKEYPDDVLEIIAPVNLRKALKLKDGDPVTFAVHV